MGLLLHGARHHGLPPESIAQLRAFDLAVDERSPQIELIPRSTQTTRGPGASG
jgi:hypothetical protein